MAYYAPLIIMWSWNLVSLCAFQLVNFSACSSWISWTPILSLNQNRLKWVYKPFLVSNVDRKKFWLDQYQRTAVHLWLPSCVNRDLPLSKVIFSSVLFTSDFHVAIWVLFWKYWPHVLLWSVLIFIWFIFWKHFWWDTFSFFYFSQFFCCCNV